MQAGRTLVQSGGDTTIPNCPLLSGHAVPLHGVRSNQAQRRSARYTTVSSNPVSSTLAQMEHPTSPPSAYTGRAATPENGGRGWGGGGAGGEGGAGGTLTHSTAAAVAAAAATVAIMGGHHFGSRAAQGLRPQAVGSVNTAAGPIWASTSDVLLHCLYSALVRERTTATSATPTSMHSNSHSPAPPPPPPRLTAPGGAILPRQVVRW